MQSSVIMPSRRTYFAVGSLTGELVLTHTTCPPGPPPPCRRRIKRSKKRAAADDEDGDEEEEEEEDGEEGDEDDDDDDEEVCPPGCDHVSAMDWGGIGGGAELRGGSFEQMGRRTRRRALLAATM